MNRVSAKLTSKGQITLPAELRRALGVGPGDRIDFRRTDQGNFELVAKKLRLEDLHGIARLDGPARSIDQILDDIEKAKTARARELAGRRRLGRRK
jgi:AbrB family looped-hinge helix DNA binding protein